MSTQLFKEERTELIDHVVWTRRVPSIVRLGGAVAALAVAGVLTAIGQWSTHRDVAPLGTTAELIGKAIETAAAAGHARAAYVIEHSKLRAAILTDTLTVMDVINQESRLEAMPGEILELLQFHGDHVTTLMRLPAGAPDLRVVRGGSTWLESDGKAGARVVVAVPVLPYDKTAVGPGDTSGMLLVSSAVDLAVAHEQLSDTAVDASLRGPDPAISLVHREDTTKVPTTIPVPLEASSQLGPVTLAAVPATSSFGTRWVYAVRFGMFGLGLVLLATFLIGLRRRPLGLAR